MPNRAKWGGNPPQANNDKELAVTQVVTVTKRESNSNIPVTLEVNKDEAYSQCYSENVNLRGCTKTVSNAPMVF